MVIMLIWRIWQILNDVTHDKEVPPVAVTMDFLDSYYKSIKLAGRFTTEEIIKGKMPVGIEPVTVPKPILPTVPWPPPPTGYVVLSI